jgi:hypothetical protein
MPLPLARVPADPEGNLRRVLKTELACCDAERSDFARAATRFLQAAFRGGVRQVVLDRTLLDDRRIRRGLTEEVRQRPGAPLFVEAIDHPADLPVLDFLVPTPTAVLLRPDVVRQDLAALLDLIPRPAIVCVSRQQPSLLRADLTFRQLRPAMLDLQSMTDLVSGA